ncbi:MAG: DUF4116 domain-containing protein, partial [Treponema sp.]|nr:DUF4116 domain-containing protein [Treponema sp.]
EVQLAALNQDGMELKHIHFDLDDTSDPDTTNALELCVAAVKQNPKAIKYVTEALQEQVKKAAGI